MTKYVIDASAAVEFLLRTDLGLKIGEIVEDALLVAPELVDVEVLSVLRRAVLGKKLQPVRATLALGDLATWQLARIPHLQLLGEAWEQRNKVSAYDSFYVATAQVFDAPLLTTDGPLSRAPALGILIHNVRLA
ncbi:MAG: type II toxin-antitoxin system VapC family toxin [Acidobacteriota bacterium]